jgi:hypothetical protein
MKKLYILLFTIFISALSFGQVLLADGFDYPDGSLVPNGGWANVSGTAGDLLVSSGQTVVQHGTPSEDANISFTSVSGDIYCAFDFSVNDLGVPYGGTDFEYFAHIAFKARVDIQAGTSGGDFTVGISSSTSTAQAIWSTDLSYGTTYRAIVKYDQVSGLAQLWIDPALSSDASISGTADGGATVTTFDLRQSDSAENETVLVDNLMIGQTFNDVLAYAPPTDPTLTIFDGPVNGSTVVDDPETATPGNAEIDFTTTNFVMSNETSPGSGISDGSGEGFIKWEIENVVGPTYLDGGSVFTSNDPNTLYQVTGLANGETYFFRAELVDNNGDPLGTPVVYSFTITIASYIDVADLAELRASTVDPDMYYRVTGQVINTHTISSTGQTLFFQDGTAGIMINDSDYEVESFNTGDAVSNIRGHLEMANGVLQLIPTFINWGAPDSTGITPGVPTVTIGTLLLNWENYESELININGITFADAGGTFVNASGGTGNYNITDSSGTTIFRSAFSNSDYIGQTIPSGNQNLVVIVSEFNGTVQVTARNLSDFTLGSKYFEIEGFEMYPNPTSLGYLNISSKSNSKLDVSVFDVLGKQVINETVRNNVLNVSKLNSGIYIMKVSQDDAISTQKLVIK